MPDAYAMHDPVAADVGLLQSAYLGVTLVVSHDFQPAGGRDSRPTRGIQKSGECRRSAANPASGMTSAGEAIGRLDENPVRVLGSAVALALDDAQGCSR